MMGEGQGWSSQREAQAEAFIEKQLLPGSSYWLPASGLPFINRLLQSVVSGMRPLPVPNLKTATSFTPWRPAFPPTLRIAADG